MGAQMQNYYLNKCISKIHLVFKLRPDSAYGLQLTTPGLWWAQDEDESLKIQDNDIRP